MSVTINSLHDCTSQTPCPFGGWGGEKEEKEKSNRRKKLPENKYVKTKQHAEEQLLGQTKEQRRNEKMNTSDNENMT